MCIRDSSEVLWNESVSLTYPTDLTPDTPYRVSADTSFVIKGWLFKKQTTPARTIFEIDTTTYATPDIEELTGLITDAASLSAYNATY